MRRRCHHQAGSPARLISVKQLSLRVLERVPSFLDPLNPLEKNLSYLRWRFSYLWSTKVVNTLQWGSKSPLTVRKTPVLLEVLVLNNLIMFPELLWSQEYLNNRILLHYDLCQLGFQSLQSWLWPSAGAGFKITSPWIFFQPRICPFGGLSPAVI